MVEQGHKLEIGGASMIGWCVANRQARIALDVGEEAARFENPFLPKTRSELALPLVSRGETVGALTIQSTQEAAFNEEDIAVLQTMADQLANAIQNARLFEDTKSRLAQFTALEETTKAVVSTLELDDLLNLITQRATTLLQGYGGIINLVDWEKREDEVVAASGSQAHVIGSRQPLTGGLSGWVALHNRPIISNQLQDDSRAAHEYRLGEEQAQSAAIAPLTIKDQVIGTLVVMDKRVGKEEFDQADLDLLTIFANQAAVAIENARLFEHTQDALGASEEHAHRMALLNEMSEQLGRAASVDEILDVSADKMSEIFAASRVTVALLTDGGDSFEILALRGEDGVFPMGAQLPVEGTAIGKVVQERRLIITTDTQESDLLDLVGLARQGLRSALGVPLFAGGRVMGTLSVAHERPSTYTRRDGNLLLQAASLLSSAIENRRLFERTQAALKEVEATHLRYLKREWTEYLRAVKTTSYETKRPDGAPLGDMVLPEVRQAVEQQGATVLTGDGRDHSALVAPIALRGAVIGALGIHDDDGTRQWTPGEIALVEAVAERLALAAENLRLLDETQRSAARDRLTHEVTDEMRRATDIDALMQAVVRKAADALGVPGAFVQLGTLSEVVGDEGENETQVPVERE
jgi:GAF domain-containing protein